MATTEQHASALRQALKECGSLNIFMTAHPYQNLEQGCKSTTKEETTKISCKNLNSSEEFKKKYI